MAPSEAKRSQQKTRVTVCGDGARHTRHGARFTVQTSLQSLCSTNEAPQHHLPITAPQEIQNSPGLWSALHQTLGPGLGVQRRRFLMSLSVLLVGQGERETHPRPTGPEAQTHPARVSA